MSNTGKKENVVSARKKEEARREACRMFRDGTPLIRVGRGRCLVFPVIKTLPVNGREKERERSKIEILNVLRFFRLSINTFSFCNFRTRTSLKFHINFSQFA